MLFTVLSQSSCSSRFSASSFSGQNLALRAHSPLWQAPSHRNKELTLSHLHRVCSRLGLHTRPQPKLTTLRFPCSHYHHSQVSWLLFEPQPPMPTGMPLPHLSHNHTGQASNSFTPTSGVKFPNDRTCTSTSRSQSLSYKLGMSYSHQLSNFYRTLHTLTPRAPAPLILQHVKGNKLSHVHIQTHES